MKKLLLIDNRIDDIDILIELLVSNVDFIIFDYYDDTFESIKNKIIKSYYSVGLIQYNYENKKYKLLDSMEEVDLQKDSILEEGWSGFVEFIRWMRLEIGMKELDWIMSCVWKENTYWYNVISGLELICGIKINASRKEIGHGNYYLEKGDVQLIGKYFVERIKNI